MRILAIGDIHGCYHALETLAGEVAFTQDDTIVTLGDYVDRGPQSKQVIEFLIDLGKRTKLVTLRGNHEVMMLQACQTPAALRDWLACGGKETLESYPVKSLKGINEEHWDFIAATLPYHETGHDFFVHANAYHDVPLAEQPDYRLYWDKFDFQPPHMSGKRMICGHTPQKNGEPLNIGHAVCIDTWIYNSEGWLTCLDLKKGTYWQANQRGETRSDFLGPAQVS
jgi:serine/threonine protein phosphatase 1